MAKLIDWIQITLISLVTVLSAVMGFCLLPFGQQKAIYWSSQFWSTLLIAICGVSLSYQEKAVIPNDKARIYISNHQSHFDIPALFKVLPVPLFFIAKKELQKVPFMGWYMQAVGMIFIDRSNREKAFHSIRQAGAQIKKGKNVFSFPEGTRSASGDVKMFKRGTFILARENNIEVVPIAIRGAGKIIPAQSFTISPGKVEVIIGEPIVPANHTHLTLEQFAAYCRQRVIELQAEARIKSKGTLSPV